MQNIDPKNPYRMQKYLQKMQIIESIIPIIYGDSGDIIKKLEHLTGVEPAWFQLPFAPFVAERDTGAFVNPVLSPVELQDHYSFSFTISQV